MSIEHKDDISIGEDQWIIFGDLKNGQNAAFNIDPLMETIIPMWKSLETQCLAACCGIDAYDLWEEDILKNTADFNHHALIEDLLKFRNAIVDLEQEVLVSTVLNNYFTKETFIEILEHLLKVFEKLTKFELGYTLFKKEQELVHLKSLCKELKKENSKLHKKLAKLESKNLENPEPENLGTE